MWNKKNHPDPRDPPKNPTKNELAKELEDVEIDLKQARQQTRSYRQLYIGVKRKLREAKQQIEEILAEKEIKQQNAQIAGFEPPLQTTYPTEGETYTKVLKRNPPQQLKNIRGLQFHSIELKERIITEDEYTELQNQNIRLKDELTMLRQAKAESDAKINDLLLEISCENDGLLKTENVHLKQQMGEEEDEIKTQKRQLRREIIEIEQMEAQLHQLETDRLRIIFDNEQELNNQESTQKDIERQLVESQENFVALQEEAELRIENTQTANQQIKLLLIESEARSEQLAAEMEQLRDENEHLTQALNENQGFCHERKLDRLEEREGMPKSGSGASSPTRNTLIRTNAGMYRFENFNLNDIKQAAQQYDLDSVKELMDNFAGGCIECLRRLDEIWSDEICRRLEAEWRAPIRILLFVFAGGRLTSDNDGDTQFGL